MMPEVQAKDWLRDAQGMEAGDEMASQVAQAIVRTHANIERAVRDVAPQAGGLFDLRAGSFETLCRGEGIES
jgi:hypothetical protein